jgi:multidrug efflux pump subunit AcrA (membrane-fusion protein)
VKAYASGEDLARIKTGARVLIQGKFSGTVSSVAPSVNQLNKKVEVKIAIGYSATSTLVVGQNVPVSIAVAPVSDSVSAIYLLPIQNVKIIPGAAFIFTVDENSKVVQHEVMLGAIQGDFVEVKTGLTDNMKIISPVYQLVEGETVVVE